MNAPDPPGRRDDDDEQFAQLLDAHRCVTDGNLTDSCDSPIPDDLERRLQRARACLELIDQVRSSSFHSTDDRAILGETTAAAMRRAKSARQRFPAQAW